MMNELKIALAQINPTVGDIAGNADLIRTARREAAALGADLVTFGELVLCGYPPEDLVLKRAFQDTISDAVNDLAAETSDGGPGMLPMIDGCLPAGQYCATVRAFSATATFDYDIRVRGTVGCEPMDPPLLSGDGAFTCMSFDTCP